MRQPRVLVGVLSAGEPSLGATLESIHDQEGVSVEIIHIADRSQFEAHRELFAAFDLRSTGFDLIVKVDADMEIVHRRLFTALIAMFRHFPEQDLIPVAVDDWLSGRRIWGLNAWRGGVRWPHPPPDLFVDRVPSTVRSTMPLLDIGEPLVLHAMRPTSAQCLRYGAHRALKASALGTNRPFHRLDALVARAEAEPVRERLLVLLAVERSLRDASFGRQLIESAPSAALIDLAEHAVATASAEHLVAAARAAIEAQRNLHGLALQGSRPATSVQQSEGSWRVRRWTGAAVSLARNFLRAGFLRLRRKRTPQQVFASYLGRA